MSDSNLVVATTKIASEYFRNNAVPQEAIQGVIASIHAALAAAGRGEEPEPEELKPAVSIKRSVTPEYIICLENGKKYKALRRHLKAAYNMTPDEYRKRWNLPHDYPMVAPAYSARRMEIAKDQGLGVKRISP